MPSLTQMTLMTACAMAAVLASTDSQAQEQYRPRRLVQISTGVCDAFAPATDPQLLREPTGLRNTSANPVRIACSLLADLSTLGYPAGTDGLRSFGITFRNPTAAAVNVQCTASVGRQLTGFLNNAQAVAIPAGGTATINWNIGVHYPANRLPGNMQCTLPPGNIAGETYSTYFEAVGT